MTKKKRILIDLLVVATVTVAGTIALSVLDVYEVFHHFSRSHEEWDLDDILLGVFLLVLCLSWFAFRRIKDVMRENRRSRMLEDEKHNIKIEKMESLNIMAVSIAHHFNNLLMVVLGNLELVESSLPPDSTVLMKNIKDAALAAEYAAEISHHLLTYVGQGNMDFEALDTGCLLDELKVTLAADRPENVSLQILTSTSVPLIHGDRVRIAHILRELVDNSVESFGGNEGTVTVSNGVMNYDQLAQQPEVHNMELSPGEYVYLEVKDNGSGISEELKERIFDPFYTTKFIGRGMGLSAVIGIARLHKGTVLVDSHPGVGTSVRCLFPLQGAEE